MSDAPASDAVREATRRSWNVATRNHNAHKGDQAARLRAGEELLFDEELALLGPLAGRDVVHLQCNAGQDSVCLARRGARVTGVDLSDEAVAFARRLSAETGLPATFVEGDVVDWLEATDQRFDVAFTSYGTTGWLPDLDRWARGVHRVLRPGGCLVYVEFHPLVWSFAPEPPFGLTGDDAFAPGPFRAPVGDYVAASGAALGAVTTGETVPNPEVATAWQRTLGELVTTVVRAGLRLEALHEWPHANGCRVVQGLVPLGARRWTWPAGTARVPLMFGLKAVRPA